MQIILPLQGFHGSHSSDCSLFELFLLSPVQMLGPFFAPQASFHGVGFTPPWKSLGCHYELRFPGSFPCRRSPVQGQQRRGRLLLFQELQLSHLFILLVLPVSKGLMGWSGGIEKLHLGVKDSVRRDWEQEAWLLFLYLVGLGSHANLGREKWSLSQHLWQELNKTVGMKSWPQCPLQEMEL